MEKDKATVNRYFNFFYSFNFIIGCIFFLGYFAIIDELVVICFGKGLEIARSISFIITLNYFIQFMRQATLLFRDATGTFYNDRWKPFFEGVLNIILSIVLVNVFKIHWGDDFAVVGVIVATIITNITICHIVEPYVLFRYALKKKMRWFILKNYTCFLVFGVALLIMNYIKASMNNIFLSLLVNGAISICISLAVFVLVLIIDKDFRYCTRDIFKRA